MAMCALTVGCNKPVESVPSVAPSTSGTTEEDHSDHSHADGDHDHAEDGEAAEEPAADDSAAAATPAVRFVADKSIKVPAMMCPYSCFPTVKETLAAVPGVEAVQLAEQPEGTPEGSIENKVVELKLSDDFDLDAAIAALKAANYDAEALN